MKRLQAVAFGHLGACLILLHGLALPTVVLAGEKQYQIEGTVTALGTTQETTGGGGNTPVSTYEYRTYTVKSPTRVFVLKCSPVCGVTCMILGVRIGTHECGGKKEFAIGDVLHLRVKKRHAFVQTDQGKEQKLEILSEALNEENAQAAKP